MAKITKLEKQVADNSKKVHTESYSMSIGEVKNLYDDKELDLHPEFQRFFRWSDEQKYKLIESILLGIPLPSFFVHQKPDGVWDVVDGLQRLSTIFEFMGVLKGEDNEALPPLQMKGTKYLTDLEGRAWLDGDEPNKDIPDTLKRDFKRRKLDFNIILKHSDESTKYELFERLNTGGEKATSQEIRNSILVRENETVYKTMITLAQRESFINTTQLSDNNLDERFDLELITRFLVLRKVDLSILAKTPANDYLNEEIIRRAIDKTYDWKSDIQEFNAVFDLLDESLGGDAFKKFSTTKKKFEGGFVVSAFEIIALGLGNAISNKKFTRDGLIKKVKKFWTDKSENKIKWQGRNTTNRLVITLKYGRELFKS